MNFTLRRKRLYPRLTQDFTVNRHSGLTGQNLPDSGESKIQRPDQCPYVSGIDFKLQLTLNLFGKGSRQRDMSQFSLLLER